MHQKASKKHLEPLKRALDPGRKGLHARDVRFSHISHYFVSLPFGRWSRRENLQLRRCKGFESLVTHLLDVTHVTHLLLEQLLP